jgi:hypothetical protein
MNTTDQIAIREGGERLYLHPFSVRPRTSKVHYLDGNEQPPYENQYIVSLERSPQFINMGLVRRLWYVVFKRLIVAIYRVFKNWRGFGGWIPPFSLLDVLFVNATPFVAESFPDIRLGLDYQLAVRERGRLTATCYLTPSQEWIAEHFEKTLSVKDEYEHVEEDKAEFVLWRNAELAKGNTIQFLVSIDT